MKQKTAIKQLIEDLKACQLEWAAANSKAPRVKEIEVGLTLIGDVIEKAESLEPVNEQQIKDARINGMGNQKLVNWKEICEKHTEKWYNETFEKP